MATNVSNTTPAAPAGKVNVKWQTDGTNASAYVDPSGGTVTATSGVLTAHAVVVGNGSEDIKTIAALGTAGQVLTSNGAGTDPSFQNAGAGSGTVTSVALTVPTEFSVAGSPITTSGTLAVSKANQSANLVYAGPSSGGAAAPTFRSAVEADLSLSNVTTNNVSTSAHGFAPILPNDATKFLNGTGAYTSPGGALPTWLQVHPDNYPASPTIYDDEFEEGSLSVQWSWVNQGPATVTVPSNSTWMYMDSGAGTGGDNKRILVETLPATTWIFVAKLHLYPNLTNFGWGGLGVRDSSSGKFIFYGFGYNNNLRLTVDTYASPTSAGSNQMTQSSWFGTVTPSTGTPAFGVVQKYLAIQNDGTNLIYYISLNGIHFFKVLTQTNNAFLTNLSQIGFVIDGWTTSLHEFLQCDWIRKYTSIISVN